MVTEWSVAKERVADALLELGATSFPVVPVVEPLVVGSGIDTVVFRTSPHTYSRAFGNVEVLGLTADLDGPQGWRITNKQESDYWSLTDRERHLLKAASEKIPGSWRRRVLLCREALFCEKDIAWCVHWGAGPWNPKPGPLFQGLQGTARRLIAAKAEAENLETPLRDVRQYVLHGHHDRYVRLA